MSTEQLPLSPSLVDLLEQSQRHVAQKLEAGEGFSAILYTRHPDGVKMTIYQLDSVEDALAACSRELGHDLRDAQAYAISYDAGIMRDGREIPLIVTQLEERGMPSAALVAFIYRLEHADGQHVIHVEAAPAYLGMGEERRLS